MKQCNTCKHYKEPKGDMWVHSWCGNASSPEYAKYVYKGGVCDEHSGKGKKREKKDGQIAI